MMQSYELIDSGDGQKLERFGPYILLRPASQALWKPAFKERWEKVHASFGRKEKEGWECSSPLKEPWEVKIEDLSFSCRLTPFGHVGLFPEQFELWKWMKKRIRKNDRICNLFAYTGGATLFAAKNGAQVCHIDASKPAVLWARNNIQLNFSKEMPIRWIVDDVIKFLKREKKRKVKYDGMIMDPPTFGRGSKKEVFKIERDMSLLLELCVSLLSSHPRFFILSCHTPGITPIVLENLLMQFFPREKIESGEMLLQSKRTFSIPSGTFARFVP